MSGKLVLTPNRVRSAYEDFLETFRLAVEDAAGEVLFPDRPLQSCFVDSGGATVEFKRCLYLRDLPCRRLSRSKRLDVAILAAEELEKDSWILKRSTVYLNYFVVSSSEARLVQSLHYDFVEGGQTNHPLFHVQLSDEPIPEAELRATGFDLELKLLEPSNECWVTTRIPTSDMTFASVLYCLVVHHLEDSKPGIFMEFAEHFGSIQKRLPPPNFDPLRESLAKSSVHFKSSHWFAHMREPIQQNS